MKKIFSFMLVLLILGAVGIIFVSIAKKDAPIVVAKGNLSKKPLPIKLNKTNDTECAMLIKTQRNAAEVVAPDGRTWFFDTPGCMVKWLQNKKWKDNVKLWVHTIDTNRWLDAKQAKYGIKDKDEMGYGFGARENETKDTIDFNEMQKRMLRGQTLKNPKWRKKILGEN